MDIFDLNALLAHYNLPGTWTGGDSTYNGQVDIFDLNGLLANYNTNLGQPSRSRIGFDDAGGQHSANT